MFEVRNYKSDNKLAEDLASERRQAYIHAEKEAERRAKALVVEAEQKDQELSIEIQGVKNAQKLKMGRLKRIHQKLLVSSHLYRKWNSRSNVAFHNIALICVFVFTFGLT